MKALSIRQPWAWAILHAGKDIENRSWSSEFRGRIAVHAGKMIDMNAVWDLREAGFEVPDDLPTGCYVGEVDIVDCVPFERASGIWAEGPFCFMLENAEAYETPVPGRGRLSLFEAELVIVTEEELLQKKLF